MALNEVIDTRQISKDANGQIAGSRTFHAFVTSPAAALAEFDLDPGTRLYPDNAALVFDRVDVRGTNGNTLYVLTATYSTFRGGRRQQEPETTTENPFFGWDYQRETVTLPAAYLQTLTTRSGDLSDTKTVWNATTVKVDERRVLRTVTVSFVTDNAANLDIIADQARKIHKIRGREYLFLGADVAQDPKDATRYRIKYTWELDRGTTIQQTPTTLIIFPGAPVPDPGGPERYMYLLAPDEATIGPNSVTLRRPYRTLDVVAAADPTTPPVAVEILAYDEDPDGWRGLPGMVPL